MISAEDIKRAEEALRERGVDISFATVHVQRALQCGYNRAAAIMDILEQRGIISAAGATGLRMLLK